MTSDTFNGQPKINSRRNGLGNIFENVKPGECEHLRWIISSQICRVFCEDLYDTIGDGQLGSQSDCGGQQDDQDREKLASRQNSKTDGDYLNMVYHDSLDKQGRRNAIGDLLDTLTMYQRQTLASVVYNYTGSKLDLSQETALWSDSQIIYYA